MLRALVEGLYAFLHRLDLDQRAKRKQQELLDKYGECSWCGELLFQPIHDTDCPARIKDERDFFRTKEDLEKKTHECKAWDCYCDY